MLTGDEEHSEGKRTYACPDCPQEFDQPEDLAPHLERHREVLPPKFSPRGKPRSFECPKGCGRHFPTEGKQAEYRAHIELCDGSEPIVNEKAVESESRTEEAPRVATPPAPREEKPTAAPAPAPPEKEAPAEPAQEERPAEERTEETMASKYQCDDCGKQFTSAQGLKVHAGRAHGKTSSGKGKGKKRRKGAQRQSRRATPAAPEAVGREASKLAHQLREQAAVHRKKAERLEEMAKEVENL